MYELGRILLGAEFFNWDFANNEGNDTGDRVRLQEAVDGQHYLLKDSLILPQIVGYGLRFRREVVMWYFLK